MANDNLNLILIPSYQIDFAWRDGAYLLGESCVEECTPDQLKLLLSRNERHLVRIDDENKTIGWGCFCIEDKPNLRILFVTNLWARQANFERFYDLLKQMAKNYGCSRIRCACLPAQASIFKKKLNFTAVYETLEAKL